MRLVQDPRNREIRPMASQAFPHDWFSRMQQRPDVAFVVPMTRQIAATITASIAPKSEQVTLNLIPTAGARSPFAGKRQHRFQVTGNVS